MRTENSGRLLSLATEFQTNLPHTKAPYASRAWGNGLHSLCSYQGKLKPALAHWMLREFTNVGDRVLDPLGGVGTIAFEAALLERIAFTCDLSPFASTIATAKLAPPNHNDLAEDVRRFAAELADIALEDDDFESAKFGLNARVVDYYHPDTLAEILRAKKLLSSSGLGQSRTFIKATLLHILHGNRPYALSRTSHPITPFSPTGDFEYRPMLERLITRLNRLMLIERPEGFRAGTAWHDDFRNIPALLPNPVNAILCSPPFPGMRFDRPNWLRMWFCGWEKTDFDHKSRDFLERQQGRNLEIYSDFFAMCNEVTTSGSPVILHVGGSKGYDMATKLTHIAKPYLRHVATITEAVDHLEKHGIPDKGATSSHILLVFERV
jgi:hypothetical protein